MNAGFTELKTTKRIGNISFYIGITGLKITKRIGNVSFYIGITILRGLMLLRWLVRLKSTFYKVVGGI